MFLEIWLLGCPLLLLLKIVESFRDHVDEILLIYVFGLNLEGFLRALLMLYTAG